MRYRTLGKTGLKVSEIGIGGIGAAGKYGPIIPKSCSPNEAQPRTYKNVQLYPVAPEEFARTMTRASEFGINFVDTAPSYGDSEKVIGHHLKDHRDQWLVSTKVGKCGGWGDGALASRDEIMEQFEESLARLQLDYIDLLLIHSLDQYGEGETAIQRVLQPGGMVDTLKELKQQGKIGFFGASGQLPELVLAAKSGEFDVLLTYNTFNLLIQDAQKELFPLAREKGIGIILGGAFYQGLLTGDPEFVLERKDKFFEKNDPAFYETQKMVRQVERLMEYVGHDRRAMQNLALRFALSDPAVSVVVSGISLPEEAQANAAACESGPLPEVEIKEIKKLLNQ